jgi:hypothetical protein
MKGLKDSNLLLKEKECPQYWKIVKTQNLDMIKESILKELLK